MHSSIEPSLAVNVVEPTDATSELTASCRTLETRCGELIAERDKLRDELAKARIERDQYLRSLTALLGKDLPSPPFEKAEMLAFVGQAAPLEDFITELDRELRSDP